MLYKSQVGLKYSLKLLLFKKLQNLSSKVGAHVSSPTPLCQAVTSHHAVSGEFTHAGDVPPTNAKRLS